MRARLAGRPTACASLSGGSRRGAARRRDDSGPRYFRARVTRLVANEQVVLIWNEIADAVMRGALHIAVEATGVAQTKIVFAFYYQGLWPVSEKSKSQNATHSKHGSGAKWLTQSDFENKELASMSAMCAALKKHIEKKFVKQTRAAFESPSVRSFGVARE